MTRGRGALGVALVGFALIQLDGTSSVVAVPRLPGSLSAGLGPGLFVAAYFLVYAAVLAPAGRLVDLAGSRPVMAAGLLLFAAGAGLTAVAPGAEVAVAGRFAQGAGAGLLSPAALTRAVGARAASERGRALGTWAAVTALAGVAGPVLGGLLTQIGGWRGSWAFLAAGGGVLLVILVWAGPDPAVSGAGTADDADAVPSPWAAPILAGIAFATLVGGSLLLEQVLQRQAARSPLQGGLLLLLCSLPYAATARPAGRLADRAGERPVAAAGTALSGLALLAVALAGVQSAAAAGAAMAVAAGLGLLSPAAARAALSGAGAREQGRASARLSLARLLGAGVGVVPVAALSVSSPGAAALVMALGVLFLGLPLVASLRPAPAGQRASATGSGRAVASAAD